jgi:hypothetical protein
MLRPIALDYREGVEELPEVLEIEGFLQGGGQ